MGDRTVSSGTQGDVGVVRTNEVVRGCLEAYKQELGQLAGPHGAPASRRVRANGNGREEVTGMWNKLFGGGDGLPREKVDAVVRVVDRYLSEEANLRGLQSERQTIHPRDLPPDKRQALIEEVFAILADTKKK